MSPERVNRPERVSERALLNAIALGLIGLSAVLGVLYLGLWRDASEDLSRLLPASTRTHATLARPLEALDRALSLDVWRDPASMRGALTQSGLRAPPTTDEPCLTCITELAGLPTDLARDLLGSMDGLELALVPAGEESALLLFIELRDDIARKRILARLRPHLETVSREVGFRIDRLRPRPWTALLGFGLEPPRLVDMEPWLILSWGSPTPLEELLEARVGGRHDALHRRPGFSDLADSTDTLSPLRLVVDARSAWQIASGGAPRPGGLIEYLDLITLSGRISQGPPVRDPLELQVEVADQDLARRLAGAFVRRPHPLLARIPENAELAVLAGGDDLSELIAATALLSSQLARDFAAPEPEPALPEEAADGTTEPLYGAPLPALLDALGLPARLELLLHELPRAPGELAVALVPRPDGPPELLILLTTDAQDALERDLAEAIPRWLGDGWAHGELTRPIPGEERLERLYLERPHGEGPRLVWRQRQRVIELASSVEALDRLASTPTLLPRALAAGVDLTAPVLALVRPDLLPQSHPLAALLRDRLRADARLALTLDALPDRLVLRSDAGLWTLLGALVSASPRELDAILLRHLAPECRAAYDHFCHVWPSAAPCQPLALGRLPHIEAVCRELAP